MRVGCEFMIIVVKLWSLDRRQAVRHWVLVPAFAGSNPAGPAKIKRSACFYFCLRFELCLCMIFVNISGLRVTSSTFINAVAKSGSSKYIVFDA